MHCDGDENKDEDEGEEDDDGTLTVGAVKLKRNQHLLMYILPEAFIIFESGQQHD